MKGFQFLCLCVILWCGNAWAIHPETGLYWSPSRSGRAVYLEVQGATVVAAVYAFDRETGAARFYTASGTIQDDFETPCGGIDAPFGASEGYYPLHGVTTDLYEVKNGQPLGTARVDRESNAEKVGRIALRFHSNGNVFTSTYLDADQDLEDCHVLTRFVFGQQWFFGHIAGPGTSLGHVMSDLRGHWVFVDQSDPQRVPWRFDFSERIPAELPSLVELNRTWWSTTQLATYRDAARNAEFRCAFFPVGDSGHPQEPRKTAGCELFINGVIVFSTRLEDVGLDRIHGFLGALPPRGHPPYRRPQTVIGLRVRTPENR